MTGETLDGGKKAPLVEARRAHASAIERVPLIAAGSRPAVVIAGRPAAEWAADARAGRVVALLLLRLPIQRPRTIWRGHPRGHTCQDYDSVRTRSFRRHTRWTSPCAFPKLATLPHDEARSLVSPETTLGKSVYPFPGTFGFSCVLRTRSTVASVLAKIDIFRLVHGCWGWPLMRRISWSFQFLVQCCSCLGNQIKKRSCRYSGAGCFSELACS